MNMKQKLERAREALQQISDDTAQHPMFLGADATDEEMEVEGGDAASITYWHQIAAKALKELA